MARKYVERKATLADALSEACSELEALAEEAREVCDNMPESLQQSARYEALDNAASELEGLSVPDDIEDGLGKVEVTYSVEAPRGKRGLSRNSRVANAVSALEAVWEELDKMLTNVPDLPNADDIEGLRSDVDDDIKAIAEGVESPGMFG